MKNSVVGLISKIPNKNIHINDVNLITYSVACKDKVDCKSWGYDCNSGEINTQSWMASNCPKYCDFCTPMGELLFLIFLLPNMTNVFFSSL